VVRHYALLFEEFSSGTQAKIKPVFERLARSIDALTWRFLCFGLSRRLSFKALEILLNRWEAPCEAISFIRLLVFKGRLDIFKTLVAFLKAPKTLEITVVSAAPLDEEGRFLKKKHLERIFKQSLLVHYKENPQLVAGDILIWQTFMLDLSLRKALDDFKKKVGSITTY